MGNQEHGPIGDYDTPVVITDLGALPGSADADITPEQGASLKTRTARLVVASALTGGLVLALGGSGISEPRIVDPAFESGCDVVAAEQRDPIGDRNEFLDAILRLAGHAGVSGAVSFAIDSSSGHTTLYKDSPSPLARVSQEGLWELCSIPVGLTLLDDRPYPTEEELGRLPEGFAYVYQLAPGAERYSVIGVRLRDGSIVDTLG